jgi:DNA gyrase subunit B
MKFREGAVKFYDSQEHRLGAYQELFIVEGDSAAQAVAAVRDPSFQAVLPMQGKPINAMKARAADVDRYELFVTLLAALGFDSPASIQTKACRFGRIILLFDPDADGIHCGALFLIYIYRRLKLLLDAGKICLVQAPLVRLSWAAAASDSTDELFCYSMEQARKHVHELESKGVPEIRKTRYRGLASLEHDSLLKTCVAPKTRKINRLRSEDAEAAVAMFG